MQRTSHFDEDVIELYSLGRLPDKEAADLEEHLLVCHACQDLLEKSDDFVRSFHMAIQPGEPRPKASRSSPWRRLLDGGWRPLPVAAALVLAAVAVVALAPRNPEVLGEVDVKLTALRGSGSGIIGAIPARHRVRLELDAKALSGQSYRIELADSRGRQFWQSPSPAAVEQDFIRATVSRPVPEGLYWVRLYDPASGRLAREYGLRAR
jgi:hypothetical protein